MGRKIKQHSYMSKKGFSDDLTLIWDNCLTYNTDPVSVLFSHKRMLKLDQNHHLRRAAQIMRKKADQIMRRIPDRHERFTPNMIERFKFATPDSAIEKRGHLTNGINHDGPRIKKEGTPTTSLLRGDSVVTEVAPGPGVVEDAASLEAGTANEQSVVKPSGEIEFEDSPALERSAEDMAAFESLDAQMEALLATLDISNPDTASAAARPMAQFILEGGDFHERLRQLGEEEDELGPGRPKSTEISDEEVEVPILDILVKRENSVESTASEVSRKRKRSVRYRATEWRSSVFYSLDTISSPRKRSRRERLSVSERTLLENWWMAMASSSLAANTIPPTSDSGLTPNPLHPAYRPMDAATPDGMATSPIKPSHQPTPR